MTDCERRFEIPCAGKQPSATFDRGHRSCDGGLILLQQVDRQLGLTARLAAAIGDERDPALVRQPRLTLLRQRIFGIACGYEDCNDFEALRADALFKLAAGRQPLTGGALASQPTLSRLENAVGAKDLLRIVFPDTEIILRGDAGLALPEVYDCCERAQLSYMISLAKNPRLVEGAEPWLAEAKAIHAETGEKARRFGEFSYAAGGGESGGAGAGREPALRGDQPAGGGPGSDLR